MGEVSVDEILKPKLSEKATITHGQNIRYNQYFAPKATTVVNVFEEQDVVATVKFCNENGLKFLAQSGAHGWPSTFDMNENDVIINLRGMNKIDFKKDDMTVTIGGGTIFKEVVEVLYQNGAETVLGTCNTVGVMGALLGGGYGRLTGMHGQMVDNLVSLRLVTANGSVIDVSESNPHGDLWWALKGAGHNFGIAVSATIQAHKTTYGGQVWTGALMYSTDKIREVVKAVNDIELKEKMACYLFLMTPPPAFQTVVMVAPVYYGPEEEGKAAFKSLFDLEPFVNQMAIMPENITNAVGDAFCTMGGWKPGMGTALKKLDPDAFDNILELYQNFVSTHGLEKVGMSYMIVECYSKAGVFKAPASSAVFPHRETNLYAMIFPWCNTPDIAEAGLKFAKKVRNHWYESSGFPKDRQQVYINFACGDESLGQIYGYDNIERLREIKKKWDPEGKFNQFFPITE